MVVIEEEPDEVKANESNAASADTLGVSGSASSSANRAASSTMGDPGDDQGDAEQGVLGGDEGDGDEEDDGDRQLLEQDEQMIKEVFTSLQREDGTISIDGACQGLDKLGIPLTDEERAVVQENAEGHEDPDSGPIPVTFEVFRNLVVEKLQQAADEEGEDDEDVPGNIVDGISGATRDLTEQLSSISSEVANLKSQIGGLSGKVGDGEAADLANEELELQGILDEAFWLSQEEVDNALKAFEQHAKEGALPTRLLKKVFDAVGEELVEEELEEHSKEVPSLSASQVMQVIMQRKLEHFLSVEEIEKAEGLFSEAAGESPTLDDTDKLMQIFEAMDLPLTDVEKEQVGQMVEQNPLTAEEVVHLLAKKRAMDVQGGEEEEGDGVQELNEEDQETCQKVFNELGPTDGKIPVDRIPDGMNKLGLPLSKQEIAELNQSAVDGDINEVDFVVFLEVVTMKAREREKQAEEEEMEKERKKLEREERLKEARKKREARTAPEQSNRRAPPARDAATPDRRRAAPEERPRRAPPASAQEREPREVRARRGANKDSEKQGANVSQEEWKMYDRAKELRKLQSGKNQFQRQFQRCLQFAVCLLLLVVVLFVASADFRRALTHTIDSAMGVEATPMMTDADAI